MSNTEKIDPRELIRLAKEVGSLDSNVTTNCFHCKAIFPLEYDGCPQCGTENISPHVQINKTVQT